MLRIFTTLLTAVRALPSDHGEPSVVVTPLTSEIVVTELSLLARSADGDADPGSLGVGGTSQRSGYLSTPSGNELFYWLFESRHDPTNDPLLIWLNGGPGCSSIEAALFENGPVKIDASGELHCNPHSWNNFANVLYIDNPAGVGFSTKSSSVQDTVTASRDFVAALQAFYARYPQYTNHKLHLSGESYAGRYIPVFAEAIHDEGGLPPVTSVLIGNGFVDPIAVYESYEPMLCGDGGYAAVVDADDCATMAQLTTACTASIRKCQASGTSKDCQSALKQCGGLQQYFADRNPYDIRDGSCAPDGITNTCYPELTAVQNYFNEASVQQALGVTPGTDYEVCSDEVMGLFYAAYDPVQPTVQNVTRLLEQNVPVLAYNGDADILLNWLNGREWTHNLAWSGQAGFQAAAARDWTPTSDNADEKAGEVTNYGPLTFLRVAGAGHLVAHDQPQRAAYLLESWLNGDRAFERTYNN